MSYKEISRGDKGEEVIRLQTFLNKIGTMLVPDGEFGRGTERGVRYAQDYAGRPNTGTADSELWFWLEQQPEPFHQLATNGIAFIAREETGGLDYYNNFTRWPHYPGLSSGITIGVGFDLRYNSERDLRSFWGAHLPKNTINELVKDIGKPETEERASQLKKIGIEVPFKAAWAVFIERTLPHFYAETENIYPSLSRLPELCRSALVSIVYNRGNSLKGQRRREMRAIRDILVQADAPEIHKLKQKMILIDVEDEIISMQRLWSFGSGLHKRRQAEANLWRNGLLDW